MQKHHTLLNSYHYLYLIHLTPRPHFSVRLYHIALHRLLLIQFLCLAYVLCFLFLLATVLTLFYLLIPLRKHPLIFSFIFGCFANLGLASFLLIFSPTVTFFCNCLHYFPIIALQMPHSIL